MNTPSTSNESPPPSNESRLASTESPRLALSTIADKCRSSQGILTPTETLELLDLAEYYRNQFLDLQDELESLSWDLSHPPHKDR